MIKMKLRENKESNLKKYNIEIKFNEKIKLWFIAKTSF